MVAIRPFRREDTEAVVALWQACELTRPWNDPYKDIERKLGEQAELFLVGARGGQVLASAMVGFDGHRGWVYYLAVAPGHQRLRLGRSLMERAEQLPLERGCPKVNLLVRSTSAGVLRFYEKLGYVRDDAVPLGKRLIPDH